MLNNLEGLRGRQFDHLARVVQAVALQAVIALRAAVKGMRFDPRWWFRPPTVIVFECAFLARALWFGGFGAVWLNEWWRVVSLLFEFGNPRKGGGELLLHLSNAGSQRGILGGQARVVVGKRHCTSIAQLLDGEM